MADNIEQPNAEEQGKQEAETRAKKVKLVKMVRDAEQYDAPHEALVHPDEVNNYRPGGWEEA